MSRGRNKTNEKINSNINPAHKFQDLNPAHYELLNLNLPVVSNSNLRLPDLRKSCTRGEGGRTRWNFFLSGLAFFATRNQFRFGCSVCGKHYSTSSNLARHRCVDFFCEMICWPRSMQFEYLANILEMAILWVLAEEFHFIMLIWFPRQTHRSPEDSKARKCPECNKVRKNRGVSFFKIWFSRFTFQCLPIPCTCEPTAQATFVANVERYSLARGC